MAFGIAAATGVAGTGALFVFPPEFPPTWALRALFALLPPRAMCDVWPPARTTDVAELLPPMPPIISEPDPLATSAYRFTTLFEEATSFKKRDAPTEGTPSSPRPPDATYNT